MQAVAQALVAHGHDVVWLTSADNEARVLMTCATFIPTKEIARIDAPLMSENATGLLDKMYHRLESRVIAQVADYRGVLAEAPVDVLLVDVLPHGARALYELGEIPVYATLGVIPMYTTTAKAPHPVSGKPPPTSWLETMSNGLWHLVNQWLILPLFLRPVINRQRAALGLRGLPWGEPAESSTYSPFLHIQASSATMEFNQLSKPLSQRQNTAFVGPLVTAVKTDPNALPSWWSDVVSHKRVVGITQGTLAMDPTSLIMPSIEALSADPSLLLVVVSPHVDDIKARAPDAVNIRYAAWLPYHVLLPQLALLITNGGYGSITQALSHGVPLLCAGQTEDKKDTAARVAWAGAGIDLKTDSPLPERVKQAASEILGDGRYQDAATRLGDELNRLGGGNRACELLEELVVRKKGGNVG